MQRITRGRVAVVGAAVILGLTGLLTVASGSVGAKSSGPSQHVLLISIDGFHASDLTRCENSVPVECPNLKALAGNGTTYSQVTTSKPSDSAPGLMGLVTGGDPKLTGVYYDDAYDRSLYPPRSNCTGAPGTEVVYDESIDRNSKALDAGGGIDPTRLPLRKTADGCLPVYPHSFLRVNTIFEVAHEAGLRTAWSDKHPAYELLNGPSGHGVDDLYTPEIASVPVNTPAIEAYDALKVKAIVNEIDGLTSDGSHRVGVPAIFGMNFQAVSVAQKAPSGGYLNGGTRFSGELAGALDFVDQALGRLVDELRTRRLLATTEIIVTAKHGQSPINRDAYLKVPPKTIPAIVNSVAAGLTASATQDDIALLWLSDQSKTDAAVAALQADESGPNTAHIATVIAGAQLARLFGDPNRDPRVPDLIVQPQHGVLTLHLAGSTDNTDSADPRDYVVGGSPLIVVQGH